MTNNPENIEKKYELIEQVTFFGGRELHRIRALHDFGTVKKGDLGGYVQSEDNLSHKGFCWVANDAKVYGEARVSGNALVYNDAEVFGNARISGDAEVYDDARVYGNATVRELAEVADHAEVFNFATIDCSARITQYARVYGCAEVFGEAEVYGRAQIFGNAKVFGHTRVFGTAQIYDDAGVSEGAIVDGDAQVYGNTQVDGNAQISDDAQVSSETDYIVFNRWWIPNPSNNRYFTWTRSNNRWCIQGFCGTAEELIAYIREANSGENICEYERVIKYVESILADEQKNNEQKNKQQ